MVDLICFTEDSACCRRGAARPVHLLHCGTVWVHGPSTSVPTGEDAPRRPFGEYGVQKAAIERYLLDRARRHGLPVTLVHPGHISGPGWPPVNPAGHLDLAVFETLARGDELALPNLGLETVQPCTLRTWPACSSPRWRTGPRRWGRVSMPWPTVR